MATSLGRVYLNGFNYELAYDLVSQSVEGNYSTVRFYGIVHVTNNYVSWSSGSASVHLSGMVGIGTYYGRGDHTVITRDFNFAHDENGDCSVGIGASISTTLSGGSGSCGGTMTLPRIDRFATMTDAIQSPNDESEFWFKYNNPRSLEMTAWLEVNPNSEHYAERTITDGGTSGTYTWELTEAERNQLRAKLPNTNSGTIRIGIISTIGSSTSASYKDRTFTIVNANPTFSTFDIEDTNTTTKTLTGSTKNNVVNINGYSNIKATIPVENKAEAIKSATMSKYRFAIGDSSTDIAYSDENDVSGTINSASNGTYNMYAIDSRNNSTLITKQATSVINYEKITLDKQNCSFVRDNNQVGENAILTINGTFWNDDFGAVINSIKSVQYRLKKSDSSTWITGTTTITPTISGNDFSFTGMIASDNLDTTWDLDSSYNLEVVISDELSSASIDTLILNSAVPTMSLDKNGVGIMCAYDSSKGGLLQVGGNNILLDGTILYENNSGTTGNIILNDNINNYDSIEIFYTFHTIAQYSEMNSTKVISGKKASLMTCHTESNSTYLNFKVISMSGTNITVNSYQEWKNVWGTSGITASNNNNIYITKVIGYKNN